MIDNILVGAGAAEKFTFAFSNMSIKKGGTVDGNTREKACLPLYKKKKLVGDTFKPLTEAGSSVTNFTNSEYGTSVVKLFVNITYFLSKKVDAINKDKRICNFLFLEITTNILKKGFNIGFAIIQNGRKMVSNTLTSLPLMDVLLVLDIPWVSVYLINPIAN